MTSCCYCRTALRASGWFNCCLWFSRQLSKCDVLDITAHMGLRIASLPVMSAQSQHASILPPQIRLGARVSGVVFALHVYCETFVSARKRRCTSGYCPPPYPLATWWQNVVGTYASRKSTKKNTSLILNMPSGMGAGCLLTWLTTSSRFAHFPDSSMIIHSSLS